MGNGRLRLYRVMLIVSSCFAFLQLTILNNVIKGLWISDEDALHQGNVDIIVKERQLQDKQDNELLAGDRHGKADINQASLAAPKSDNIRQNGWGVANASGLDVNVAAPKPKPDKMRRVQPLKMRPTAWPTNSFISPYHKHWDVNCSDILSGKRQVVKETNMMLKKLRDKDDNLPIPTDEQVEKWMENCSEFKKNRHYLDTPLSDEEENYPLAYIILSHKEVVQVERLLRSVYQPHHVYCIHPDEKSPPSYQSAIRKLASCFDNVFIASKIEKIQYAGYTRLQADINCMDDLLKHPVKWKYVMNLCGQDFPLKTNLEIIRQLKAYNGHNDINGIIPPKYIAPRTSFHHKMDGNKPMRTKRRKSPPPHNLTVYFGNAYYAATRQFVDFVIHDKVATDLLSWSNDTWSPDEHYWVTLQRSPYAPGGYPNATWDENIRFMKWGDVKRHPGCQGKYVRALCVFGVGYLEYLHTQPYLFANKFYYTYDPIAIQCVEEMLDNRMWHPELSDKLDNFPVRNLVWQNYTPPKNKR